MNEPEKPKNIVKYPNDLLKKNSVRQIIESDNYKNAKHFRNQCFILKSESVKFDKKGHLTHNDIADLFGTNKNIIKHQIDKAKKENDGKILPNGRPFTLNESEISQLHDFVTSQKQPPKKEEVQSFIQLNFEKNITNYRTMQTALHKSELKTDIAEPMEAERFYADQNKIDFFYSMIESYFKTYDIPSHFVLNLDEEGHEDFADATKQTVVVSAESHGPYYFPVKRTNNRTTFLACITGDGCYLKPLIVIKRKTIEARFCRLPIIDKIFFAQNDSGFITTEIFNDWIIQILVPYIQEKRKQMNYNGPAVLLLDGCSCHYTFELFKLCNENFIKIFFLPPHSSNQTQPLDLVVFHLHKDKIRKFFSLDVEDKFLIDKLDELYSCFQSIATLHNIKASFEAAGAIYEIGDSFYPIIRFSKDFATHLINSPKNKQEKKELSIIRKGLNLQDHETRLKIVDLSAFWKKEEEECKNIKSSLRNVPKIIDQNKDRQNNVLVNLLSAFVEQESVMNEMLYPEQSKGKPKKAEISEDNINYRSLDFEQKLFLELESLDLNDYDIDKC